MDGHIIEEGDGPEVLTAPREEFTKRILEAPTDRPPLQMRVDRAAAAVAPSSL